MLWFNKKRKSDISITLSSGEKLVLYELTNKIVRKADSMSFTVNGCNYAIFYSVIENELLPLSQKQIDNLSIKDSNIIRTKIKSLLVKEGLITIKENAQKDFDEDEVNWFKQTRESSMEKYLAQAKQRVTKKNGK